MDGNEEKKTSPMLKLATHIVDKRNLVFLLTGIALIFSLVAKGWVSVENDLTAYLPPDCLSPVRFRDKRGPGRDGKPVHHLRLGKYHGGQRLL